MDQKPHADPLLGGDDVVEAYRRRSIYLLTSLGLAVMIPFAIAEFFAGRMVLGTAGVVAILILTLNTLAVYRRRSSTLPMGLLVLSAIAIVGIALRTRGFFGALWSYPAVLLLFFVLSRGIATLYSAVILVSVTVMIYSFIGTNYATRYFVTLALTILNSNIFVSIAGQLQRRLLEQTIRDPLTGAYNRRHIDACLGTAIERQRRYGAPASLLIIDIDNFKQINDRFGHVTGDEILKQIVALISRRARKLDSLCRIGGEEFMLLLPETTEDQAAIVAEHLRAVIADSALLKGWALTVSVGVGELQPGQTLDSWITLTDDALYEAKAAGRNRVARSGRESVQQRSRKRSGARAAAGLVP